MGYDIELIRLSQVAGVLPEDKKTTSEGVLGCDTTALQGLPVQAESYLSYNFYCFNNYWALRDQLGKRSEEVAKSLVEALARLDKDSVVAEIPNESCLCNGVMKPMDGWTPDIRVFAYHLKRLHTLCHENPKCLVIADIYWDWQITEKDLQDDDEVDDTISEPAPVTYYRHPIDGTIKVDTFAKAADIYARASLARDPRAPQWLEIAKQLPGAPH